MRTQGELEQIPLPFQQHMSELENRIMTDLVNRLKANREITSTADWQMNRLRQLGISKEYVKQQIKEALEMSDAEIDLLYGETVKEYYIRNRDIYKKRGKDFISFEKNKELQQLISATKEQTTGEFRNITGSLGFAIRGPDGKIKQTPLLDFYQGTLDTAMMDIGSGSFDYNTVLKRTIQTMTNSGLRTIDYNSGRSYRVDVAARMCIMTGMNQVQSKMNEEVAKELGTEYFEVSWHGGARPSHQVWQGKVYSRQELESVCGLGSPGGLCGVNCYHNYDPYIPGVSVRTYTDDWLEKMNQQENEPKPYQGKEYTTYEALQEQRRLERLMRKQRQDIRLFQSGEGDKDDILAAQSRYRITMDDYAKFSRAMKLPQQKDRIYQDGLGRIGRRSNMASVSDKIEWPSKGQKINNEEYRDIMIYAREKRIELSGFKQYDGKTHVVRSLIDDAESIAKDFPEIISGKRRLTIALDDTMSNTDFAVTKGHIVNINANAFRNPDYLAEEYGKLERSGWFVKGTDYHAIIKHEIGHVVGNLDNINGMDIAMKITGMGKKETMSYVKQNLSEYAGSFVDGSEIISEVFADVYGSEHPSEFSLRFIEECAKIKKRGGVAL